MRIRSLLLATFLVGLAACGWTQPGFDAGHSEANGIESHLTSSNVGALEQHTVDIPGISNFFVVRGWLIVNSSSGSTAYDRSKCPRADNGPCTSVWTRAGQKFMSSDGTNVMFFATGAATFDAVDFSGATLWSGVPAGPLPTGFNYFAENAFTISGTKVLVPVDQYSGHGSTASEMNVFSLGGCGAASCVPDRTFFFSSVNGVGPHWAASGDRLIGRDGPGISARSISSGQSFWTAADAPSTSRIRDGKAYVETGYPDNVVDVFDLAGVAGCSSTPTTCAPLRRFPTPRLFSVSDGVAVGLAPLPNNEYSLSMFAADGTECSGSPAICPPRATTTSIGNSVNFTALTPQLLFAVGDRLGFFSEKFHLYAFSADSSAGCGGTPKVCSPLLDIVVSGRFTRNLEVWDGRVYAQSEDGVLHVFSLPGAIT